MWVLIFQFFKIFSNFISSHFQSFAAELQLESENDFDLEYFKEVLNKAGGANYGTGVRDH